LSRCVVLIGPTHRLCLFAFITTLASLTSGLHGACGPKELVVNHILLGLRRCSAIVSVFVSLFWQAPLCAQTTVVVTGAREALAPERLVADVVVIDRARIDASAADSLEELLRRAAGVQVSRNGGPGANAGVLVRGASSAQTLVLVDGVRIGSATTGQAEFEGLSLASIERIEVLRGPASSLYGADAVGGVVQIFTRQRGTAASAAVGALGAREAALSGAGQLGAIDASASVSHEQARGVSALRPGDAFGNFNPDRDGHARTSASARLGWALSEQQKLALSVLRSQLNAQYDGAEFLPPSYAQNAAPDFRNRLTLQSGALEHRGEWSSAWRSQLRLSQQSSDLVSGGSAPDRFRTERRQLDAQLSWTPTPGQQLTVALEHLNEDARASVFAAEVSRRNNALVLAYAGRVGAFDVQADVRHDDNSVYGGVNTGRLGAAYTLAPGWRLRGLLGSSFRAPSFNDLYYPGFGVASIQPERGRSAEVGLVTTSAGYDASATLWRNRVSALVAYEADRSFCPAGFEYDFGCARNIGRARLQGATLAASQRSGAWRWQAQIDFLDARDQAANARLTRRAAHQESFALDWHGGAWRLGAELVRVGARPEGGRLLAAYSTLDLKAQWRIDTSWSLQAKLLNAGNKDYEPAQDYRASPRQAWLGLRWNGAGA
jgi:vitamin B12 transporter